MRNIVLSEQSNEYCRTEITLLPQKFSIDVSILCEDEDEENGIEEQQSIVISFMDNNAVLKSYKIELEEYDIHVIEHYKKTAENDDICNMMRSKVVNDIVEYIHQYRSVDEAGNVDEELHLDMDIYGGIWEDYLIDCLSTMSKSLE